MEMENLYNLIHALTNEEKQRYRRQFEKEKPAHFLLFCTLIDVPTLNNKVWRQQKEQLCITQQDTCQLEQELLNLSRVNLNKPTEHVKDLLTKAQWLYDKDQYVICLQILNKAKRIAQKYENFDGLRDIATLEFNLKYSGLAVVSESPRNDIIQYTNLSINYDEYIMLYLRVSEIKWVSNRRHFKQLKRFLQDPLLQHEGNALSKSTKMLYHHIKYWIYSLLEEYAKAYQHIVRLISLYEKNLHLLDIRTFASNYAVIKGGYIQLACKLTYYDKALTEIELFRQLPKSNPIFVELGLEDQIAINAYLQEIKVYWAQGRLDQILALYPSIKSYYSTIPSNVFLVFRYRTYAYIARTLFIKGAYSEAMLMVKGLLENCNQAALTDSKMIGWCLQLMIWMDLGKQEELQVLVERVKEFMATHKRRTQFEVLFINFMSLAANWDTPEQIRLLLEEYHALLEAILAEAPVRSRGCYYDIVSWMKAKLTVHPLEEVLQERLLQEEAVF